VLVSRLTRLLEFAGQLADGSYVIYFALWFLNFRRKRWQTTVSTSVIANRHDFPADGTGTFLFFFPRIIQWATSFIANRFPVPSQLFKPLSLTSFPPGAAVAATTGCRLLNLLLAWCLDSLGSLLGHR